MTLAQAFEGEEPEREKAWYRLHAHAPTAPDFGGLAYARILSDICTVNYNLICFFLKFFQATYTLSRKIVRNRAVSSYRVVCMLKKKKKLCPEWDLNCCTPAWRSELLPTGLLESVNRC